MSRLAVKKGLDPFQSYKPTSLEDTAKLDVNDSIQSYLLYEYHSLLQGRREETITDYIQKQLDCHINSAEIQTFLESNAIFDEETNFLNAQFINRLVQNAYEQGNNPIEISFKENMTEKLRYLGGSLRGKEHKPLSLKVMGDSGVIFGTESEHCDFYIQGQTGHHFGGNSKNCTFTLDGPWFSSENVISTTDCTFKSTNLDAIENFLRYIREDAGRNRFIYVSRGKEKVVRDSADTRFQKKIREVRWKLN